MPKKTFITSMLILALSLILVACQTDANTGAQEELQHVKEKVDRLNDQYNEIEEENKALKEQIEGMGQTNSPINVIDLSLDVMERIKDNDMSALSTYVHPSKGLRFTPYTTVDSQNGQVFTPQEVASLSGDNTVYNWGNYDGSGFPIELSFSDYYGEFVYDQDFLNPHMIGNGVTIATGNMIDNMDDAYPDGSFVEFYFTGFDPQYEGMDWVSLTLVFEDDNGDWKLVGIVHNQWTI